MRVLLLNPPGRRIYIRDYLCSKTTKSNYLFHPVDLVVLSGLLAEEHEVSVLDCMAERLPPAEALVRIQTAAPEVCVMLVGAVSWEEDRVFGEALSGTGIRILAIGDILHEASELRLRKEPWIEAAVHVFANGDVPAYLRGELERIEDMTVRDPDAGRAPRRIQRVTPRQRRGSFRIPRPRHELFPERGYRFSFAREKRFATVLTDYGCPYPCTFCVIGTLGFQTRPTTDVLDEIDFLRTKGKREIFFVDQTFGVKRKRALELCRAFEERGDLSWTAFTRPDTLDSELADAMRRGGCHTVILGAESADEAVLKGTRKGYDTAAVRRGFQTAKYAGLRTVGTFILGLPEETDASLERTLQFALELELDFLSLNVAVPRPGTAFRSRALELGLCTLEDLVMDQGGGGLLPSKTLNAAEVIRLKRRFNRRFYLRPGYLWKRLRAVRTPWELFAQAREGAALLRRNL